MFFIFFLFFLETLACLEALKTEETLDFQPSLFCGMEDTKWIDVSAQFGFTLKTECKVMGKVAILAI